MMLAHAAILLVALLMHIFPPLPALNAIAPVAGMALTAGIAYGTGPRHRLDVYAPHATGAPTPVVVFFYGGGWETGEKAMYRFVGAALAARGVLVVIPDYRLHPEVRFPAFMDDAAAAVAWARANAARFGGDPHRIVLMGHSAGGNIATLLALDPGYLRSVGMSPADVCGVIGLAGAYDFVPARPEAFAAIFGPEAEWARSRPISYVSARAPPMLLLAGRNDGTVEPGNSVRLAARLRAAGADARVTLYPGITHMALIAAFSRPFSFLAPVREDALHFIAARPACGVATVASRQPDPVRRPTPAQ